MASQESGKQRAARIPLDYFKRPDLLERWKIWLAGVAFLLALGWVVVGLVRSDQGRLAYSPGQVAFVHAAWESKCEACHTPFSPQASSNWLRGIVVDSHLSDERCMTCHAGTVHHKNQLEMEVQSCSACHAEHRGREASLTRVPDRDCTTCHSQLEKHLTGPRTFNAEITGFAINHPEFKAVRDEKDQGKLKFNHKMHMSLGLATPEAGDPNWTLAKIAEAERARYRAQQADQSANASVQLQCSSCHVNDVEDFTRTAGGFEKLPAAHLPTRSPGAFMLPIVYENHCRGCHPLTFDPRANDLSVPHRLQPDAIKVFLWKTYAAQYLSKNPKLLERSMPSRQPIPGKTDNVTSADEDTARKRIDAQVADAEKILYLGKQTCGECHHYEEQDGQIKSMRIVPTNVPGFWFKHARFDHTKHRAVDCRLCHDRAYASNVDRSPNTQASRVSEDLLIPGMKTCLQCHSPLRTTDGAAQGGARFDCTECHLYHGGDSLSHGAGSQELAPRLKYVSLQNFLKGLPSR